MVIKDQLIFGGKNFDLEYHDADTFDALPKEHVTQVYGVCFCDGKLVIGFDGNEKDWGLIGGTVEESEGFQQTLMREIQEESNMKVLEAKPIGYQKVIDRNGKTIYQLRYWCRVKPYGPFISDPAGSVTEIKLIEPLRYKEYFNWGKIGDRLINRALKLEQPHF